MAIDKKKMFADALIGLCRDKHLSRITIKDILEITGMCRQTFYNHFIDKNDLINWTYFTRITGDSRHLDERGLWGFVYDSHNYCVQHKNFFTQACSLEGQNTLKEYMIQHNYENYLNLVIEEYGEDVLTDELLWAIEFNAYGAINMHIKWVNEGMLLPPEVKTRYVIGCIPDIIKRYLPDSPAKHNDVPEVSEE